MDVLRTRRMYRRNAPFYDLVAPVFEGIRTSAITALGLRRGETVLDLGCGTGLSFDLLESGIGESGHILGMDQSPEMLARAAQRIRRRGWRNVRLITADATAFVLPPASVDAVLCCLVHDLSSSPEALGNAASALRDGGRFVAAGIKLRTGRVSVLPNALVRTCALLGVAAPLTERPWSVLEAVLGRLDVTEFRWGTAYVASGIKRPPE